MDSAYRDDARRVLTALRENERARQSWPRWLGAVGRLRAGYWT